MRLGGYAKLLEPDDLAERCARSRASARRCATTHA